MNKRIQELVQQCTERCYRTLDGDVEVFDKEKFAELIVQECLNIVGHYTNVDEGIAVAKKNFGIEE